MVPLYKILADKNAPYCHGNTFFLRILSQNQVLEITDDVTVKSFCNQSQQNFVFLFVISRSISVQNLSKMKQETKKLQKMGNDVIANNIIYLKKKRVIIPI